MEQKWIENWCEGVELKYLYKIRRIREIESVENPSKIAWNWAYSKTYI